MPPPPLPPGAPGHAPPQPPTHFTVFEKARKHKPMKQMKKVNWVKVPKTLAVGTNTLWHATKEEMDVQVSIDPVELEDLFSRQELKKDKKPEAEKKQPSVVSLTSQWLLGMWLYLCPSHAKCDFCVPR